MSRVSPVGQATDADGWHRSAHPRWRRTLAREAWEVSLRVRSSVTDGEA